MRDKKDLGDLGERLAVGLLKRQGYKILEQNFHCRTGEIDIVGVDNDTLVFVEVKTRFGEKFGLPEESVTARKIRSIERAGAYFRLLHPRLPEAERIDVIAIEFDKYGKIARKELIKNATC